MEKKKAMKKAYGLIKTHGLNGIETVEWLEAEGCDHSTAWYAIARVIFPGSRWTPTNSRKGEKNG